MRTLAFTLIALAACAGDPLPLTNCTAGVQTACACPGGSQGAQRCAADGSGFGACVCEGRDAGTVDAPGDGAVSSDATTDGGAFDAVTEDRPDVAADAADDASCPAGYERCDGRCQDLATSTGNCGTCGHVCSADFVTDSQCQHGTCVITGCFGGHGDCDRIFANGCERPTTCGGFCAPPCPTDAHSTGGCGGTDPVCFCAVGFGDCDESRTNGCETNLRTTECAHACPTRYTCNAAGVCRPPA